MKDLKSVHAYGIKQLDIGPFNDCYNGYKYD